MDNIFVLDLNLFSYLGPEWVASSVWDAEEEGGGGELSIGCPGNDDDDGWACGVSCWDEGSLDWPWNKKSKYFYLKICIKPNYFLYIIKVGMKSKMKILIF